MRIIAGKHRGRRLQVPRGAQLRPTADRVRDAVNAKLKERGTAIDFDVVSNPEFLKEGAAVNDFMKPHRIIVGTDSEKAAKLMASLYEPFNRNHERIFLMDTRSAELTKYAANCMLATVSLKVAGTCQGRWFMTQLHGLMRSIKLMHWMYIRSFGSGSRTDC